jgi:GT2 family glycosyltransferase
MENKYKNTVSIIIINYNGKNLLMKCIKSIKRFTTYPNYEIIVIDNNSTDGSIEMLSKKFKDTKIIKNSSNLGFSKACNIGIKKSKGEYILLLNNDVEILEKDWLKGFLEVVKEKDVGIVGCKLIFPDGKLQHAGGYILPNAVTNNYGYDKPPDKFSARREVDTVSGAALLIKREIIEQIGLLSEEYFMFYEETEWCKRCKERGYKIIYSPKPILMHDESKTVNKYYKKRELIEKSRMIYIKRNFRAFDYILAIPFEILYLFFSIYKGTFLDILKAYKYFLDNISKKKEERKCLS